MFGRRKDKAEGVGGATAARPGEVTSHPERPGAKNRPTPKRRDAEAARRRPLVETDRKSAREAERAHRREQTRLTREAMVTGDDRHLPLRDKGPERRFVRDYVDARWNVLEFLLPIMLIALIGLFVNSDLGRMVTSVVVYGMLLIALLDFAWMWRGLKRTFDAKFGADRMPRGSLPYALSRAAQMRRTRMPRPMVERGQRPR